LGPQRMSDLGRALGIRTAGELREAAAAGRLREAPGIGPSTEAKIRDALERPRISPRRALTLNRAWELVGGIADALEGEVAGDPPPLVELAQVRGDLHVHTTWSDGKASVLEMAEAARELGYDYIAICDHARNVRVVPGLDADEVRRQGEEIAAANEQLAPF